MSQVVRIEFPREVVRVDKRHEAEAWFKAGDFQEAFRLLEEILKDNPEDVTSLYNLGMCYTELCLCLSGGHRSIATTNVD
jgi:tetratricopeptide (TPR) repeat protein